MPSAVKTRPASFAGRSDTDVASSMVATLNTGRPASRSRTVWTMAGSTVRGAPAARTSSVTCGV